MEKEFKGKASAIFKNTACNKNLSLTLFLFKKFIKHP